MPGLKAPFRPMEDVLGKRPGIATNTGIRRAPDYAESLASRSSRIADIVRGSIEQDPSDDGLTSFTNAPMNVGKPNPYGSGIDAYEPNTQIFDGYERVYNAEQQATVDAGGDVIDDTGSSYKSSVINADGKVSSMINAAMGMVGKYYVWGGTTSSGVDCSGLIYYAFNAAGIEIPRYRAVDFRNMGTAVSMDQALPGDIIYIDNANSDTDHVGIYIGNGQMIVSPTTGQKTQVQTVGNYTSIRRILSDGQLGQMSTPPGSPTTSAPSYSGSLYKIPTSTAYTSTPNRWL